MSGQKRCPDCNAMVMRDRDLLTAARAVRPWRAERDQLITRVAGLEQIIAEMLQARVRCAYGHQSKLEQSARWAQRAAPNSSPKPNGQDGEGEAAGTGGVPETDGVGWGAE